MFQVSTSSTASTAGSTNTCPRCGGRFNCGMEAGAPVCWCAALPRLAAVPDAAAEARCYCRACLEALMGKLAEKTRGGASGG